MRSTQSPNQQIQLNYTQSGPSLPERLEIQTRVEASGD